MRRRRQKTKLGANEAGRRKIIDALMKRGYRRRRQSAAWWRRRAKIEMTLSRRGNCSLQWRRIRHGRRQRLCNLLACENESGSG